MSAHHVRVRRDVALKLIAEYTMSCTADSPHVCRGGNNAAMYFP